MWRVGITAWIVAALSLPMSAQPKSVGAFSPEGAPSWVTFGGFSAAASDEEYAAAAERSRRSGFGWVLQIGYGIPAETPAGGPASEARARAERAGLWPYVIGVTYGEEWHERCLQGEFAYLGLTAGHPECGPQVQGWMSRQHAAVRLATRKPIVWVTGMVHPTRPVPRDTDYVAVDYYPADGQSFEPVRQVLMGAEAFTDLPLVLIPRWFRATGPFQGPLWRAAASEPDPAWMDGYAAVLRRPRWVAMWGFLGADRPYADLVGLWSMPTVKAAVERSLGVR